MMSAFSPFARLPLEYMMMPQPTAQYVQVLRVSVVPASLKGRIDAAYAVSISPNPSSPIVRDDAALCDKIYSLERTGITVADDIAKPAKLSHNLCRELQICSRVSG